MIHNNGVKVRWSIAGRHEHLTIILYIKFSSPIVYSNRENDQNTKNLNIDWWNLKIRSVSNKTYQQDMQRYTLQSYNTPNVVVLMIKETEK